MRPDFDPQPTLSDALLTLRPLIADDLEPLYAVAKDPEIWAGHPARTRHERAVFEPYFGRLLGTGTALAVTLNGTDQIIGCSRYYEAPDQADSVAIGYTFLGRDWWGGTTNFAMKSLMLHHAFGVVDSVWLHIGPSNIRSQKATAKLGAVMAREGQMALWGVSGIWQSWRLDRADWDRIIAARSAPQS